MLSDAGAPALADARAPAAVEECLEGARTPAGEEYGANAVDVETRGLRRPGARSLVI